MAPFEVFSHAEAWFDTTAKRAMTPSQMAAAQSDKTTYAQRSIFSAISLVCIGLVAVLMSKSDLKRVYGDP